MLSCGLFGGGSAAAAAATSKFQFWHNDNKQTHEQQPGNSRQHWTERLLQLQHRRNGTSTRTPNPAKPAVTTAKTHTGHMRTHAMMFIECSWWRRSGCWWGRWWRARRRRVAGVSRAVDDNWLHAVVCLIVVSCCQRLSLIVLVCRTVPDKQPTEKKVA